MGFKGVLKKKQALVNNALKKYLSVRNLKLPEVLSDALRYSVFSGGKRFRPVLTLLTAEALGVKPDKVMPGACAIELIHNFSLIHDDMPCMDNDDYRRGRLTCHKKFDEAVALLAGDALVAYAFKLLADNCKGVSEKDFKKIISELSDATVKMISGQVKDITIRPSQIDDAVLNYIHSHKTGALIRCAVRTGAVLSGATGKQLENLTLYGQHIGLIFQITDDILDMNEESGKVSFPLFYGLSESMKLLAELAGSALDNVKSFGTRGENLKNVVHYLLARKK
ncbi:MAG: polyprenyl synthetase family protein [Armatimonadota bacterium]